MDNKLKKNFGKRVKTLRNLAGMTQEQLAEKLNLSTVSVANIERGRAGISFAKIEILAKSLGVKIYQLFTSVEDDKTSVKQEIIALLETASTKQINVIKDIVNNVLSL